MIAPTLHPGPYSPTEERKLPGRKGQVHGLKKFIWAGGSRIHSSENSMNEGEKA
jgi:hypothetical protein